MSALARNEFRNFVDEFVYYWRKPAAKVKSILEAESDLNLPRLSSFCLHKYLDAEITYAASPTVPAFYVYKSKTCSKCGGCVIQSVILMPREYFLSSYEKAENKDKYLAQCLGIYV